ncbi:uncharacterized protein [Vulpes vulpes]|uniref:Basic proline-rich protein-like n=1 Tax=Vulpes vulpes TaxID=9627 RepID=A0ABM4YV43_VULVU
MSPLSPNPTPGTAGVCAGSWGLSGSTVPSSLRHQSPRGTPLLSSSGPRVDVCVPRGAGPSRLASRPGPQDPDPNSFCPPRSPLFQGASQKTNAAEALARGPGERGHAVPTARAYGGPERPDPGFPSRTPDLKYDAGSSLAAVALRLGTTGRAPGLRPTPTPHPRHNLPAELAWGGTVGPTHGALHIVLHPDRRHPGSVPGSVRGPGTGCPQPGPALRVASWQQVRGPGGAQMAGVLGRELEAADVRLGLPLPVR